MLVLPNFKSKFVITDVSSRQLGVVLIKHGRPITFYSCKLNSAQYSYTIERELFSIVETPKEFKYTLLSYETETWTDHKS